MSDILNKKVEPDDKIPVEIYLRIFSFLKPTDLLRCNRVNKEWKLLSEDQTLWGEYKSKSKYLTEKLKQKNEYTERQQLHFASIKELSKENKIKVICIGDLADNFMKKLINDFHLENEFYSTIQVTEKKLFINPYELSIWSNKREIIGDSLKSHMFESKCVILFFSKNLSKVDETLNQLKLANSKIVLLISPEKLDIPDTLAMKITKMIEFNESDTSIKLLNDILDMLKEAAEKIPEKKSKHKCSIM